MAKGPQGTQDGYDFFVEAMPSAAGQGLCMSSSVPEVGPFYTVDVSTEEFAPLTTTTTTTSAPVATPVVNSNDAQVVASVPVMAAQVELGTYS